MFRWKPDHLSAVGYFEAAAKAYRIAGATLDQIDALEEAAKCHEALGTLVSAANHYLSAARETLAMRKGESKENAAAYFQRAGELLHEANELREAADSMIKAAEKLEKVGAVEKAKDLYMLASSIFEESDKEAYAMDTLRKTLNYCLRNDSYDDALTILGRMERVGAPDVLNQPNILFKCAAGRMLIHMAQGDPVAADRALTAGLNIDGFASTPECAAVEDMLIAFKKRDEEAFDEARNRPAFNYLEQGLTRLAKTMTLSGVPARNTSGAGAGAGAAGAGKSKSASAATKPSEDRDALFGSSKKKAAGTGAGASASASASAGGAVHADAADAAGATGALAEDEADVDAFTDMMANMEKELADLGDDAHSDAAHADDADGGADAGDADAGATGDAPPTSTAAEAGGSDGAGASGADETADDGDAAGAGSGADASGDAEEAGDDVSASADKAKEPPKDEDEVDEADLAMLM